MRLQVTTLVGATGLDEWNGVDFEGDLISAEVERGALTVTTRDLEGRPLHLEIFAEGAWTRVRWLEAPSAQVHEQAVRKAEEQRRQHIAEQRGLFEGPEGAAHGSGGQYM